MTIEITNTETFEQSTRTVVISLQGAPDIQRRYARSHVLRPAKLVINYAKDGDAPWTFGKAVLSGPRVLKDGRLVEPIYEAIFSYALEDAPEWARSLIDGHLDALNLVSQ